MTIIGSMSLDEFLDKLSDDYARGRKSITDVEWWAEWAIRAADEAAGAGKVIVFV